MSLPRTLEPELMDDPAEALAYDAMDHSEVNRQFVDDYLAMDESPGDVLDLGTGTARIPVELCRRDEGTRVLAADFAPSMLDVAKINIELAGFTERIRLDLLDGKSLDLDDDRFDSVISNSLIHHLPEPSRALSEAVRVVKPGGWLFFRDLMRPESSADVDQLVRQYAGDEEDEARSMFQASLHAALTLDEIRELATSLGFEASSVQATSDRHWTWAATKSSEA